MVDFDPDAYLATPTPAASGFDPDAYLKGSSAPRSLGDIASSALHEAVKPLASMPSTYADINREAREQIGRGVGQLTNPEGSLDYLYGAGNVAGGGLSYVTSPITAPMRSLASRPLEETTGIPKEYTEFALSLLPWMPKGTGLAARTGAAEVPSAEALKTAATQGFESARESGVRIPAADLAATAQKLEAQLHQSGARAYLAPKTYAFLNELKNAPEGAFADAGDLHGMRQAIGDAAASADKGERRAAMVVKRALDQQIEKSAPELKDAIANYAALSRSATVTGKLEQANEAAGAANSGMNLGNAIRQRFKSILLDPKQQRGYTPDEIAAMRQIVRGTYTENALRIVGNILGGGGGLGSLAAAAAGAHAEGMAGAIGFPAIGMGVRRLGAMLTERQVNRLDEMLRARSPLGEQMAASQAERQAAAQWGRDYINSQAHPSLANMRNLNASSRGLALILNRNLGTDVQKAIPWLQNPAVGHAAEPEQQQVPGEPSQQHHGGGIEPEQKAHGGPVRERPIQPHPLGARQGKDGKWYIRDPSRPGKFLRVDQRSLGS